MAQLVVRNIEESVKSPPPTPRPAQRPQHGGRGSRHSAECGPMSLRSPSGGLGTEIANLFKGKGYDFEVTELRGYPVRPATFDEE